MSLNTTDLTALTGALMEIYKQGDPMQFNRTNDTVRHMQLAESGLRMKGDKWHWKAWTDPMSAVRRVNAVDAETTEFPAAQQINHEDLYIQWSDLTEFRGSVEVTGITIEKTKPARKASVFNAATRLKSELESNFSFQVNAALHQTADCVMAVVADKKAKTGGAYSQADEAFLQIDQGSIAMFHKGQRLDIRAASDNNTVRVLVYVEAVYMGTYGPGGTADIGPGITVKIDDDEGSATHLDAVVDGDEIVLSGETDDNFQSLPRVFSFTGTLWGHNKADADNEWCNPVMYDYTSGGSAVTLDVDTHLTDLANHLGYEALRVRQSKIDGGITIPEAFVCISTPKLLQEHTEQVGDAVRYTSTLDASAKKKLFGRSGFEGAYWHSPNMGPVALVTDRVATPHAIRFIDPSTWKVVTAHEGGVSSPEWLKEGENMWFYERGANGRLTNVKVGGALVRLAVICDAPKSNAEVKGVKSSRES